jgi:hypothetical protein
VRANLDAAKDIQAQARMNVPKRTGMLMASIDASHEGDDALVGPTASARSFNGPYGRAVELGGMRHAHNASGRMWWPTGEWSHSAVANMMPSQPYLAPAVAETEAGRKRIYYDAWLRAQQDL